MARLNVIGAGAWGTALACALAGEGKDTVLWARRPELAEVLERNRENVDYLPGIRPPDSVRPTSDLAEAASADVLLLAVPSIAIVDIARSIPRGRAVVSCAKGLAAGQQRLSQALGGLGFERVAVLSGPNHAEEIGAGLPAATVVASRDGVLAATVQQELSSPALRVYTSDDVTGVELSSALKNVIALAAGMVDGLGLGDNAKAALVTRGLREMVAFATTRGARPDTLYGLAGLGDLLATCFSRHSRNRAAGERLARGEAPLPEHGVVEGIPTAARLVAWGERAGLDFPIAGAVHAVATGERPIAEVVAEIMLRPLRPE